MLHNLTYEPETLDSQPTTHHGVVNHFGYGNRGAFSCYRGAGRGARLVPSERCAMSGVSPVDATQGAAAQGAAPATSNTQLADAFAQSIIHYMGLIVQNAQNDIQDAVNDTTSDPDAFS